MTGYTAEEAIGQTPRLLQGPETHRAVLDVVRSHLEAGSPLKNTTTVNYRKDGTPFWVEWNIAPVRGEDGQVQHWVSVQRDVTEQRALQAALREREEYLSVTLNSIGDAVIATDPEGHVTEMNDVAEELTGWAYSEAEGRSLDELIRIRNAKTGEPVESPVAKVLRKGRIVGMANHTVLIARDGTERQIADSAAPIRTDTGELLGVVLTFRDVTAQYRRREALRRQRDLLENIFEASPAAIITLTAEGELTAANGQAQEVLGLEPSSVTEWTLNDLAWRIRDAAGDPIPEEELPFTRVVATGESVQGVELSIEQPDGTRRLLSVSGAPLTDPEGRLDGAVFVLHDITKRRRQEAAEQRFGRLLDGAPSEIYVFDAETLRFVQTSHGAQENLGYAGEELAEMTPLDLNPYDRPAFEELLAPLRSDEKELVIFETTHRRRDGTTYPVQVRLQLSRQETPPVFIAIALDITEQKRRERELLFAKERAEEMSRLKSAFLANMSHEIRTPLTSIIGFADLLQGQAEGEARELLEMIRGSGKRLEETLTSVLDLAKIEGESMHVQPEPVDLAAEGRTAAGLFRPRAEAKGIDLSVDVPRGEAKMMADPRLLRRVFSNLISNAVKFTEEGQVTVRLRVSAETAVIEVEDTGIGIADEQVERIFEEFAQESEGITRDYEGVGLGLSITRRLVDLLGGQIEVESEKGVGSLFRVTLPRERLPTTGPPDEREESEEAAAPPARLGQRSAPDAPLDPDAPPEPGEPPMASAADRKGHPVEEPPPDEERPAAQEDTVRVLHVEDNALTRRVLPMLLRRLDERYAVEATASAEEALARAETTRYDLFLIDINLGAGSTGIDAMRQFRDLPRYADTPMIACTAYAMPGDRQTFLEAGFDAYLAKPFRAEELLETLQHALN